MKFKFLFGSAALAAAATSAAAQAPAQYELEYLGPALFTHAINSAGDCVGLATVSGKSRPWVYLEGGGYALLPLPEGMDIGEAHDINDQGEIVGEAWFAGVPDHLGVKWTPNGSGGFDVQLLGSIPGFPDSTARCINDAGVVVGTAYAPSGAARMVLFSPSGNVDLSLAYGVDSQPRDLSDAGTVVTTKYTLDLSTGVLSFSPVATHTLNELGQYAGSILNLPQNQHAVRWTPGVGTEVLSSSATTTPFTVAYGINESGDVVFQPSSVHFDGLGSHFLHDLLVPGYEGWVFNSSWLDLDINDSRQILAPASNSLLGLSGAVRLTPVSPALAYCTAGISASGCQAALTASGTASASAASGFDLLATSVEGGKDGLFFFGASGRQANPWGNGTSYQCVVPPVTRGGLLSGAGTPGQCDGTFTQDLNALWSAKPAKNPGAGELVQAQLWYRDPQSTSNQTTSLSHAIEFLLGP